jgi:predicted flap endonuclease-1-like 5' DNA nuclease
MTAEKTTAGFWTVWTACNVLHSRLHGRLQRAENGFCVLRAKARGHRELVTVIGHAATISAGEWITANGEWVNDRTHGQQFKARFLRTSAPTSADGIEKYLSSGMIRGVGPAYAKRLVRAFGEKVFDVIEATPDRLREVEGIGPVRAASILAAWIEWHDSCGGLRINGKAQVLDMKGQVIPGLYAGGPRYASRFGAAGPQDSRRSQQAHARCWRHHGHALPGPHRGDDR